MSHVFFIVIHGVSHAFVVSYGVLHGQFGEIMLSQATSSCRFTMSGGSQSSRHSVDGGGGGQVLHPLICNLLMAPAPGDSLCKRENEGNDYYSVFVGHSRFKTFFNI